MQISDDTVTALVNLLSQSREGTLGVLFGQDLQISKNPPRTEEDILKKSQIKRTGTRKDDGQKVDD